MEYGWGILVATGPGTVYVKSFGALFWGCIVISREGLESVGISEQVWN